jgi:hypothetical protein
LRSRLLEARPKTHRKLRLARFLWYLDRVRGPLEWAFLLKFVLGAEFLFELTTFNEPIWSVLRWLFLAWFTVLLLNAISERRRADLLGTARLRQRSLWLIASWSLLLGLGLELTEDYAGTYANFGSLAILGRRRRRRDPPKMIVHPENIVSGGRDSPQAASSCPVKSGNQCRKSRALAIFSGRPVSIDSSSRAVSMPGS